jgi:hypothetical protein
VIKLDCLKLVVAKIPIELCQYDVLIDKFAVDRTGGFYIDEVLKLVKSIIKKYKENNQPIDVKVIRHIIQSELRNITARDYHVGVYKPYDVLTGCIGLMVTIYDYVCNNN